jgi:D-alanine-D-alanine ligase
MISKNLKIMVLMGGVSREREVSLKSGNAVLNALRSLGYRAAGYGVDDEQLDGITRANTDVAFVALHGRFGEDGSVQRILEERGIPYTGSGPEASRRALDKVETKHVFISAGVPTANFVVVNGVSNGNSLRAVENAFGFPCVVKPANEGSSIGVAIVKTAENFPSAIAAARNFDPKILVEKFISGREFTCGILGSDPLPLVELKPAREFYDYAAKYANGSGTEYSLETGLSAEITARIQKHALDAHKALECRGISRIDVILSGDSEPYFLEVNTIPGMTERSLLPKAAAAAGYDFGALCEKIIALALEK